MIASFVPCVNYITGSSANGGSPTAGCCKAVESLTTSGMECMCLIVTGNVPFSLPSMINQALAIQLPKACNSKSVPVQCKSSGVLLPPAGPALFVPPPPTVLPPSADSPALPPSPSGSETAVLAPTPSEMSPDNLPVPELHGLSSIAPHASAAPSDQHGPPLGSGIRPVLTPASASNQLQSSPSVILLMLVAITVTSFREVLTF
ncbi:hypothetical protein E3N88_11402 [Mikania micrantha]|uniref:Bifunctional inhibitor/plant lipid transfer protein/seed storage helical domain-containing protein n=1 Tax=Mikania micrantha TaxID=192012 RepID=A0A5N6PD82_9ASTR|nr:hypothetical protein E3N88_11402 [Mikania micrantha]